MEGAVVVVVVTVEKVYATSGAAAGRADRALYRGGVSGDLLAQATYGHTLRLGLGRYHPRPRPRRQAIAARCLRLRLRLRPFAAASATTSTLALPLLALLEEEEGREQQ